MLSNLKLGFGLMRLPKDKQGNIQIDEVQRMVDSFMDKGFNYFDTAYAYDGSEEAIKETLVKKYPRDSFTLADKLPAWKLKSQDDVQRIFTESLQLCGVDYFDFYLLHSIEKSHYPTYEKYQCFDFVKEMKKQGKIKYIGFSFHDDAQFLDKVLTEHPEMDFVQLQLNYLDWENGVIQSRQNYEVARKHQKPIVVMEPIKGGSLANLPKDIAQKFLDYNPDASISSWALRYVASLSNVKVVLSGMSTYDQVLDNLKTFENFEYLNQDELMLIQEVRDTLKARMKNGCTGCSYCMPCPFGVDIPSNFKYWNNAFVYDSHEQFKDKLASMKPEAKAENCRKCGKCEKLCPQQLSIRDDLQKVSEYLNSDN